MKGADVCLKEMRINESDPWLAIKDVKYIFLKILSNY